jgi:NitT/TauT family transport system substrate-binding protein
MLRTRFRPWPLAAALLLTAGLLSVTSARAAEPLRVGNDAPSAAVTCPMNYGMDHGIFARHGLDIDYSEYFGTAKGQPALIGGTIEILLGAGSEMAFIIKGSPELGVGVISGAPSILAMVAAKDGKVHDMADLKGRKLAITNPGGLTDWLAKQVILREHIAPDQITVVSAGSTPNEAAMLRTGQIDAALMDIVSAYALEANGTARIVLYGGRYVPDFVSQVILANDSLMQKRPAVLRSFVAAWFEAQDAMLKDDAYAVSCTVKRTGATPEVAAKAYAILKPDFSPDGKFPAKAMDVLVQSFVDTGVLPTKPDPSKLYTEAFLPSR